jgi:hypothetical protein
MEISCQYNDTDLPLMQQNDGRTAGTVSIDELLNISWAVKHDDSPPENVCDA